MQSTNIGAALLESDITDPESILTLVEACAVKLTGATSARCFLVDPEQVLLTRLCFYVIFGLPRLHASLCAPLAAAVAPLPR